VSLFAELRRRNVIRMAGLYLVGAWLVVQVAGTLLPMFGAPEWVARSVVVLLAIGFVPVLVFSWVFEMTPAGLKRDSDIAPGESIAPQTARRMDRMIFVVMAAALGYFAVDKFVLAPARTADGVADSTPAGTPTPARADAAASAEAPAASRQAEAKSIAVLAFADLSQGKDQEYFSDGVAEEILNALAKVDDLKVAGRTSSFYFKGRNESLAAIGSTLGVAHVLEGSVRKQGERLRISAKLLRVDDGVELWSESFDGTDGDIFALQENIAREVTRELQVALNAGQGGRLVDVGTRNADAYALYLRASATFNRRDGARYPDAIAQLEQATALDPQFARAYARLAALHVVAMNAETVDYDEAMAAIETFARRALQIDPSLAEPHAALGQAFHYQRRYREGSEAFATALRLDPADVTANFWHSIRLLQAGYRQQGIAGLDRTLQLDPLLPNALLWRGREHVADGELDQAERLLRRAADDGHAFVGIGLSKLEAARGNRTAAISQLATGLGYFTREIPAASLDLFARACFGDADARARTLELIDAYLGGRPARINGVVPYVLLHASEPARAFELLQRGPTNNDAMVMGEVFSPPLAAARRVPEFPGFLRAIGLAAYWDEAGPPEQCRKDAGGDYRCE
jgi:TolB-like protein/Tfp pilus assembly protein PilF